MASTELKPVFYRGHTIRVFRVSDPLTYVTSVFKNGAQVLGNQIQGSDTKEKAVEDTKIDIDNYIYKQNKR